MSDEVERCRRKASNASYMCIPVGKEYVSRLSSQDFNPNEKNSAIEMMLFVNRAPGASDAGDRLAGGDDVIGCAALLQLVSHLMAEPAFDQLRTKEQLGYIVNLSPSSAGDVQSLRVIVQSNSRDPLYLESRIESFLEMYRTEVLAGMTQEYLATNIAAVVENLLEPPKNIDKVSVALRRAMMGVYALLHIILLDIALVLDLSLIKIYL